MIGKKGTFGYIKKGRRFYALITFLLLAAVLIMYFGAKWYFGTNKNAFTIFAALSSIGVGKYAVDLVMFCRAGGCSESARDAVESHIGKLAGAYDLYMTSYDKNFAISHAVVGGRSVCALTEDPGCDIKSAQAHIRTMMERDRIKGYTVKIFTDCDKYTGRLDELNLLEEGDEKKNVQSVMDLLKSISL